MEIDVLIDKLTPCLEEVATGRTLQTTFSVAQSNELIGLKKHGWFFDWTAESLKESIIYKLTLKGDRTIQGLIAVEIDKEQYAIYVPLVSSAPHNLGKDKQYIGVGGHLFAIAIKLSLELGFGGFVYMNAKNMELVRHYSEMLGAVRMKTRIHEFRMAVLEENARQILEQYTLEGDLNVD